MTTLRYEVLLYEFKAGLNAYLTARPGLPVHSLAGPEGIDAALKQHKIDALLAITGGPAWPTDPVTGDHFLGGCSSPAAVAGYPHITVPLGMIYGLPVNLSIFGAAFSEPLLIRIAHAFEQATQHIVTPRFLLTIDLQHA